jgi:hypothetical protein
MIPAKLEFCAGYIMWREKQPETQITIYPKQGFSDSELAAEIVRRYNTFEGLLGACKEFVGILTDDEIEMAREAWSNTNTAIVYDKRAKVKLAITQAEAK